MTYQAELSKVTQTIDSSEDIPGNLRIYLFGKENDTLKLKETGLGNRI